jgi:rSAM/selenodomain-associated transferase 2
MVASTMKLSVIIPTLDANHLLPACVARLRAGGVDEVIVCDGGTKPPPGDLGDGVTVISGKPGRGRQLKAGAERASGDWLLFLHADTQLGDGWMLAVQDHMANHFDKAGVFRFQLDDQTASARRLERIVDWRCRLFALPYGDQGLLISRTLYDEIGGFSDIPIMEDVEMARRLGRSRLRYLEVPAVTSAARYRRDGYLKRMGRNLVCLSLYFAGVSPERIRKIYA